MASNILALPFRKTTDQSISSAMKQYISAKYNQHPDMFQIDFKTIDALRRAAVQVTEPHVAGVKKIMAYAAQLAWIERKFPIDILSGIQL